MARCFSVILFGRRRATTGSFWFKLQEKNPPGLVVVEAKSFDVGHYRCTIFVQPDLFWGVLKDEIFEV